MTEEPLGDHSTSAEAGCWMRSDSAVDGRGGGRWWRWHDYPPTVVHVHARKLGRPSRAANTNGEDCELFNSQGPMVWTREMACR
jgi:hypothetical protein